MFGYVKQVSAMSQNYYPERLGRLYLINAPWGFSGVWNVVKGWLDPVTVQKIHVLGSATRPSCSSRCPPRISPRSLAEPASALRLRAQRHGAVAREGVGSPCQVGEERRYHDCDGTR